MLCEQAVDEVLVLAGNGSWAAPAGRWQRLTWFFGATMCQEQVTPAG